MIAEPRVFDDEYLPQRLHHREAAENDLARAFEPTLVGEPPRSTIVAGPHGVGKTVFARHTLDRLQQSADIETAYVATMGLTTGDILRGVLEELVGDVVGNEPLADLDVQLRERVNDPTIVVLDEADDLPATDALPYLLDVDGIGVVPIVHDPDDFLSRVEDGVRDRLHGSTVTLDRFGVAELADILESRAERGLSRYRRLPVNRISASATSS